jgi:hypothetical protein
MLPTFPRSRPQTNSYGGARLNPPRHRHQGLLRPLAYKPGDEEWGPTDGGLLTAASRKVKEEILRRHPQIKSNFRAIVKGVTGGTFSEKEMNDISREILDNVSLMDGGHFRRFKSRGDGIVELTPIQGRTVERLMSGLPHDGLGRRVREAYETARKSGRLRVRTETD